MTKKKKILIIFLIFFLLAGGVLGILYLTKNKKNPKISTKQEDIIKEYNYTIKEIDPKLKKELFKDLKSILSESEIDYEQYAQKLAQIFVVDVYDLNSKINKYDIGGLEYVLEDKKDNFKLVLQDSLYSNLKDNTDGDRKQNLPIVSKVEVKDCQEEKYTYKDNSYDAYVVNVLIDYEKDLGYDKNVSIKMIKEDTKLFVVKVDPN